MTRMIPFFVLTAAVCSARADAATGPISTTPLPSLVSQDDYPAAALRANEQGTVGFRLDVGNDGRVRNCVIVSSSGSSSLDATTCRIMASRARFTPATNDKGQAVDGSIVSRIAWRLGPARPENPRLNTASSLWISCVNGETAKRAITDMPVKTILDGSYAACRTNETLVLAEFKQAGMPDAALIELKRRFEASLPKALAAVRAALGIAPVAD